MAAVAAPVEWYDPAAFGLPIPGGQLMMRLFPVWEAHRVNAGGADVPLYGPLFERLGIQNIRTSGLFGDNFKQMPGIILSLSIGFSPITNDAMLAHPIVDQYAPHQQLLEKYVLTIVSNFVGHILFNGPHPNNGGINAIFDITEGTILAHRWNVHNLINYLLAHTGPVSISETQPNIDRLIDNYNAILTYVRGRFAAEADEPLYMILIHILYATFRKLKHAPGHWNEIGHLDAHPAPPGWFDYNLRIYLLKRRGRFVHNTERGLGRVPEAAGDVPAIERNLSNNIWLSMAQYFRFLPLIQKRYRHRFTLGEEAVILEMKTLRRMITRDAHACATSSGSAAYDAFFFNRCFNIAQDVGAAKHRVLMFGTTPAYKYPRHACLYDGESTYLLPGALDPQAQSTFGVLAGVCWFYNHNFDQRMIGEEAWPFAPGSPPRPYSVLTMPFRPLVQQAIGGQMFTLPDNLPAKDLPQIVQGIPGFWSYGCDEYFLSEFLAQILNEPAKYDELNVHFFTINWLGTAYNLGECTETQPLINYLATESALEAGAAGSFTNFIQSTLLAGQPESNKMFMETFFGSINTPIYAARTIDQMMLNNVGCEARADAVYNAFTAKFRLPTLADLNAVGGDAKRRAYSSLLDTIHRYDRPLYARSLNAQNFASRFYDDGTPILPTNRFSDAPHLVFALENKIPRECILGPCGTDPVGGLYPYIGAPFLVGGSLNRNKIIRKTRKRKNYLRKSRKLRKLRK